MSKLNLPPEFYTIDKNLRTRFNEIASSIPSLWEKYEGEKLPPTIGKIYEDYFSSQNYSGEEMGVFEGWQGLTLIKNAMVLGYLWGKKEAEFTALQEELSQVYELMKKVLLALLMLPQFSQAQMAIQSYADNKVLIGVNDNLLKNGGISRELVNQNRSVNNWNLVQGTIAGSILFKTDSGNMPLKKLVLHLEGGKELTIEDESGSLTLTMAKTIPVNFSVVHPSQGFKTEIVGSERITVSSMNSGVFSGMRISGGMFCDVQGVCFSRSQTVSIMNYLQQILPSGIAISNLSMEKYAQTSDSLITVANIMQKGAGTLQVTLGADILNLVLSGGDNKVFEKQFLATPIYVQKGTGSLVPNYVLP